MPLRRGFKRPHKVRIMKNGDNFKARCPDCEWEGEARDTQEAAEADAKTHGQLAG